MSTLSEGIHPKLSIAEYLALPAISGSDILDFDVSPENLAWKRAHPEPSTEDQTIGIAFHWCVLEPDLFDVRAPLSPYSEYRTDEARAWRDDNLKKGNVPLKQEKRDLLLRMRDKLRAQPWFNDIFAASGYEMTALAKHHKTGVMRRCRWDWIPKGNFCADLKTSVTAAPSADADGFGNQIWNLGYWRKAAYQLAIWNALNPDDQRQNFVLVAIEKTGPCSCQRYRVPGEFLEAGYRMNEATLYRIAECERSGIWPGYADPPHQFAEMPQWAWRAIEPTAS